MTGPDLSVLQEDYKQSTGSDTPAVSAAARATTTVEPVTLVRPAHADIGSWDGKVPEGDEDEEDETEDGDIKGVYFETEDGDHQAFHDSDDDE